MKRFILAVVILMCLTGMLACAPGGGHYNTHHPAGFFSGIWHGWIAPVSLIVGLFNHHIRVYETDNTGWWYDFGFYMAIISGFGGLSLTRKRKASDKRS